MKRIRSSGQSAVLSALLMGMLIVAIAMATNAGKLVTEKIAMQNAVDLAVYSGAATQAGYMNEMRRINDEMWEMVRDMRQKYERSPYVVGTPAVMMLPCGPAFDIRFYEGTYPAPACALKSQLPMGLRGNGIGPISAEIELRALRVQLQIKSQQLEARNRQGKIQAERAARDAADLNYPGTSGKVRVLKNGSGFATLMETEEADVDVTYKGWCMQTYPGPVPPTCHPARFEYRKELSNGWRLPGWRFKERGETLFVAGIERAVPASPFLDIGGYFRSGRCGSGNTPGGNGRCSLNTYAAAAPYWGKLGSIDPNPDRQQRNWDDRRIDRIDRANDLTSHRPGRGDNGRYRDYRVRFIGLWEPRFDIPANVPFKQDMKH